MEFSLDQLRTGLRPGLSYLDMWRSYLDVEIAPTWSQTSSKPNSIMLSWSQTGSMLVADLPARASELDDRPNSSSLQVCNQLRTCLRPASNLSATRIA